MTSMSKSTHMNQNEDKSPTSAMREGFSEVKRDAGAVREDLSVLREDATELGAHAVKHAADAVKSGAQTATDMAKSASGSVKKYHESMCTHVKQNPTAAVLLALGVGVVAGKILSARR